MADIPAKTEIGVTTGPIRGSRKIHVGPLNVAMRAIDLEPTSGEPPLHVYDTSGPYTDTEAHIDIMGGLPQRRRDWIMGRGDVESYDARELRPEDNGQLGPDRSGGVPRFPRLVKTPLASKGGRERQPDALCPPRHRHARDGICRDPRKSRPRDAQGI